MNIAVREQQLHEAVGDVFTGNTERQPVVLTIVAGKTVLANSMRTSSAFAANLRYRKSFDLVLSYKGKPEQLPKTGILVWTEMVEGPLRLIPRDQRSAPFVRPDETSRAQDGTLILARLRVSPFHDHNANTQQSQAMMLGALGVPSVFIPWLSMAATSMELPSTVTSTETRIEISAQILSMPAEPEFRAVTHPLALKI